MMTTDQIITIGLAACAGIAPALVAYGQVKGMVKQVVDRFGSFEAKVDKIALEQAKYSSHHEEISLLRSQVVGLVDRLARLEVSFDPGPGGHSRR